LSLINLNKLKNNIEIVKVKKYFEGETNEVYSPLLWKNMILTNILVQIIDNSFKTFKELKKEQGDLGKLSIYPHRSKEKGDYIDYRHAINHVTGYAVNVEPELGKITIIFNLVRKRYNKILWKLPVRMGLREFETLFRDFRKFSNIFVNFNEHYET
jgi:hypothetical protein